MSPVTCAGFGTALLVCVTLADAIPLSLKVPVVRTRIPLHTSAPLDVYAWYVFAPADVATL